MIADFRLIGACPTHPQTLSGDNTFEIQKATPAVTLTVSPAAAVSGEDNVILTAVVGKVGTGEIPTGTVSFYDGSALLGTATLAANGTCTLTLTLGTGDHDLKAVYGGNDNYNGADSNTIEAYSVTAETATTKSSSGSDKPGTGDSALPMLWLALLLGSISAMTLILFRRKRRGR